MKFIVEYLDDGNVKGAALRSGIPEKYASRQGQWLKKLPMVKKALENDLNDRDLRRLRNAIRTIDDQMRECRQILGLDRDDEPEELIDGKRPRGQAASRAEHE